MAHRASAGEGLRGAVMQNLKSDAVLFLTRGDADARHRDAAKLLARCDLDLRHVEGGRADVLISADHDVVSRAKHDATAGYIENALREAADAPIRHLQWVESRTGDAPRPGSQSPLASPARTQDSEHPRPRLDKQGLARGNHSGRGHTA